MKFRRIFARKAHVFLHVTMHGQYRAKATVWKVPHLAGNVFRVLRAASDLSVNRKQRPLNLLATANAADPWRGVHSERSNALGGNNALA